MSVKLERPLQEQLDKGIITGVQAEKARELIKESEDYRVAYGEVPIDSQTSSSESATMEIPKVSKETYQRLVEALAKVGYDFVAQIEPKSMDQLVTEDRKRPRGSRRLGYVHHSKKMRAITPPKMEVAIDSKNPTLHESGIRSTDGQLQMIKYEEIRLKRHLPKALRNLISVIMPDPSTQYQMDEQFQKQYGKPLYIEFYGRSDVETVSFKVAYAGRSRNYKTHRLSRFRVEDFDRGEGLAFIRAVPAVVLPQVLEG